MDAPLLFISFMVVFCIILLTRNQIVYSVSVEVLDELKERGKGINKASEDELLRLMDMANRFEDISYYTMVFSLHKMKSRLKKELRDHIGLSGDLK